MIDVIIPVNNYCDINKTLFSLFLQKMKNQIKITIINNNLNKNYSKIIEFFNGELDIKEIKTDKVLSNDSIKKFAVDNTNEDYFLFIKPGDVLYSPYILDILYNEIKNGILCEGVTIQESLVKNEFNILDINYDIYGILFNRHLINKEEIDIDKIVKKQNEIKIKIDDIVYLKT